MRKSVFTLALLILLVATACSPSSSTTSVPATTSTPHCKDGVCIQQASVYSHDNGDLFVLFALTDQAGQVSAAHPPQLPQVLLGVKAYQSAPDQAEKLAFEQELSSEDFICWVTNTASWTKGQLRAVCGFPVARGSMLLDVRVGHRLKVNLAEFNFEQVVEVTYPPEPSTNNASPRAGDRVGGTRIVLAPADCSGWTASSDMAEQLYQASQIILYRLDALLHGPWMDVAAPVVFIDECAITVELSPLGDPTPYIQLIQQPGCFELVDSGSDYHAPGVVLRTTGNPSPTVPISAGLQSTLPYKKYEVIATNADLDPNQLMVEMAGNSRLRLGFREVAAQKLAQVTTAHRVSMNNNVPYYLCILLDSTVQSCNSISGLILDSSVVVGFGDNFTASRLDSILRHGELPLELKIIKTETIYSETTN